jgi:hypothetical protein
MSIAKELFLLSMSPGPNGGFSIAECFSLFATLTTLSLWHSAGWLAIGLGALSTIVISGCVGAVRRLEDGGPDCLLPRQPMGGGRRRARLK